MLSYNLDLEPFGPCNSEPLKKSKSGRSQIFFEISRIKNFAIFKGNHLCWDLFLIKLLAFTSAKFLKRDSNTGVFCGYRKPLVITSDSPTTVQRIQGVSYLIWRLHVLLNLIKNVRKTLHK